MTEQRADAAERPGGAERPRRNGFLFRLVTEKPLGAVGLAITVLLLFTGVFADLLAPYGLNEMHTDQRLAPPSARFWLGTDNLGRDLLSRVIHGARVSMIVGLSASAVATVISVGIGMLCGYVGGAFDLIVQRFVDAVMSLPMLIVVAVVMSMVGQGMLPLILVMGIGGGISGSRQSRGFTINVVADVYVQAAAATGARTGGILLRHVLPNIAPLVIVGFTVLLPGIILTEAALSFLGYGVPPPAPSWGAMLIVVAVVMSMVGQGMLPLILVMGIGGGISGSRQSRGFTINVVADVYVQAAAATGARTGGILLRHVLPNIAPLVIVGFTVLLPGIILTEAALSFLGYGVPPPAPSWGAMLSGSNRSYLFLAPWMVLWPGIALSVVVYGTHMFGDALRDLLDPRLRGGAGRYGAARRRGRA